jgi:hypothetical protein
MANNPDFKKITLKNVEFFFPKLNQPYRFDAVKKASEPCAPTAQGAAYSLAFDLPFAEAKVLAEQCRAHYEECKLRNPKLPAYADVFGMKKNAETKTARFSAKKGAVSKQGEINKPPRVVDAALRDIEDKAIWSGSKGNVSVIAFPATDPNDGRGGISFLLDAVQVLEAVYGGDSLEDTFGPPASLEDLKPETPAQAAKAPAPADSEW